MKKKLAVIGLCMVMLAAAAACGKRQETDMEARSRDISADLTFDHSMELSYAEEFAVDYYEEGYALITVARDGRYLLVPANWRTHHSVLPREPQTRRMLS